MQVSQRNPTHRQRNQRPAPPNLLPRQHRRLRNRCDKPTGDRHRVVGLVSAFLRAGTAHVISTLWSVEARSAACFMIYFYQQLLAGIPPAAALQQTQTWLQTVTNANLAHWLETILPQVAADRSLHNALLSRIRNLQADPDTMSYQDPYYSVS